MPDNLTALVEIHDDAGWSLSLNFGKGEKARDRMRALSDAYRTGQLVPRAAVEALQDCHDALISARAFILKTQGTKNQARDDAIAAAAAALASIKENERADG